MLGRHTQEILDVLHIPTGKPDPLCRRCSGAGSYVSMFFSTGGKTIYMPCRCCSRMIDENDLRAQAEREATENQKPPAR